MGAAPECTGRMGEVLGEEEMDQGMRVLGDPKWWPPGFRFHPTDEEIVLYYLKRKICRRRIRPAMIADLDVYKWEPWELPEKSLLRNRDKQWYFFSPRDRKYPNGSRSNRATKSGYWKATGKDRTVSHNSKAAGNKKTLVYYHGRAPKGARTDWVMHEYTLDELALMCCNDAQDSYALYKLFMKSGPGPKNGEQYGAPFREEDWDDDGPCSSPRNQIDLEWQRTEHCNGDSVSSVLVDDNNTIPFCDIEDFLLQMPSEQQDIVQQCPKFSATVVEENIEAEVGDCILGPPSYIDVSSIQHSRTWCEESNVETASFQIAPSADDAFAFEQLIDFPEITSSAKSFEQCEVGADEEFLEIEDFNCTESEVWNIDNANNINPIHEIDGFDDPYDYFDAQMFLNEAMGSIDGTGPSSYVGGVTNEETQIQTSLISSKLWTHDQAFIMSTTVDSNQVMASPTSGVISSSSLSEGGGGETWGPIGSPPESWFRSAISSFLDSIPSSPAIASENALINRALVRVSSFRTGQIRGGGEPSNTTGNGGAALARRGSCNGGFLFISFLVGIGAVLWVVTIGATIKVLKGIWSRFISS